MVQGKPCFYTNRPVDDETPSHLKGRGVRAEVFEVGGSMQWGMWSSQRLQTAPISPDSCLPYGTVSPDKNLQLALNLQLERPYYFSLYGEYGRYRLYFCLIKDNKGQIYLSRSVFNDRWQCTDKPIPPSRFDRKLA
jgi:hypothetical protein